MHSPLRLFSAVVSLGVISACSFSKPPSADVPALPVAAKGLPFSLPKTILNVDLTVVKTTKTKGQFCQYADLFLFLKDDELNARCTTNEPPRTVVKAYAVTPTGVPDSTKTYLLPPAQRGGWAIDTASAAELTERGLLNSVSDERTNRRLEVVVGIIKAVASVVARAVGGAELTQMVKAGGPSADEQRFRTEFLQDWQLLWNFDRIKASNLARATDLVALWKKLDPALFAARAAYDSITQLDTTYGNLLGGQGAVGAVTLIAEVRNEIESRRNQFFLGTSEPATWTPTFEADPGTDQGSINLILIDACGAKLAVDANAKLISNPLPGAVKCDEAKTLVSLKLTKTEVTLPLGKIEACVDSNKVLKGVPFIVPADVTVGLNSGSAALPLPGVQIQISQWGKTSCLTMPGASYTAAVTYWASTGAIKSVKFTNKSAFSKETVDALGGVVGDVQKAVLDSRKKAAEDAQSKDLNELRAERERLEERVKIKAACATLGITCEI